MPRCCPAERALPAGDPAGGWRGRRRLLRAAPALPARYGAVRADRTHSRARILPPADPGQAAGQEARGADAAGDRRALLPVLAAGVQRQHVEGLRRPRSAPSTVGRAHLFHPLAELRLGLCQPPGLLLHAPSLSPGLSRHVCPMLPAAPASSPPASSRRGPSHPLHSFPVQAELHHRQHAGAWLRGEGRVGAKAGQADFSSTGPIQTHKRHRPPCPLSRKRLTPQQHGLTPKTQEKVAYWHKVNKADPHTENEAHSLWHRNRALTLDRLSLRSRTSMTGKTGLTHAA